MYVCVLVFQRCLISCAHMADFICTDRLKYSERLGEKYQFEVRESLRNLANRLMIDVFKLDFFLLVHF